MIDALEPRQLFSFGQVDTAWATNGRVINTVGGFVGDIADITVAGGKIYAVADHVVFRYNANGSLDTSYGIAGDRQFFADTGPNVVRQVVVAPTGELFVLCTLFDSSGAAVIKFTPSGALDTSFGTNGVSTLFANNDRTFVAQAIAYANGKILVAGSGTDTADIFNPSVDCRVFRLKGDGTIDASFGRGAGQIDVKLAPFRRAAPQAQDEVGAIRTLADGSIVLAGGSLTLGDHSDSANGFFPYFGKGYLAAAKFSSGGVLDPTYGTGGIARVEIPAGELMHQFGVQNIFPNGNPSDSHYAAAIRDDGSAIVAGRGLYFSVANFHADGSLDYETNADGDFQLAVPTDLTLLPDGRAVVAGIASDNYRGHGAAFAQILTDGTIGPYRLTDDLDPSTVDLYDKKPESFSDYFFPHPIATAPDGEVLIGGQPNGGTGIEVEKFQVGNAADPRPDYFADATINDLVRDEQDNLDLAYYDSAAHTLKFARRAINGQWTTPVTVDATPFSGDYLSMAFDAYGRIDIAYHEGTHGDLKFARSSDGGATWSTQTIDSQGSTGLYPSLAVQQYDTNDGSASIAYYQKTRGDLRFAQEQPDGSWKISTVDHEGDVGRWSKLLRAPYTSTPDPVIGYADDTNHQLKLATQQSDKWQIRTLDQLQGDAEHINVMYGPRGFTTTYYDAFNADLKIADGGEASIVASKGAVGLYNAQSLFPTSLDLAGEVQTYAYNKTTDSVSLYYNLEGPLIQVISGGGNYLSIAHQSDVASYGDAAFFDSSRGVLRVGTVFTPINDQRPIPED